ncbi:MAG: hypothetical protein ACOYJ6_18990 [Caulobacterales bacterium]
MADASKPRDALAAATEEEQSAPAPGAGVGLLERLKNAPVIGYPVKIAVAVVNLPKIVGILSRHYSAYHSEVWRLNLEFVDLEHALEVSERHQAQSLSHLEQLERAAPQNAPDRKWPPA